MNELPVSVPESALPFPLMHACASATFLHMLIVNSPIATVALDSTHRCRMANPAFLQLFGYSEHELLSAEFDEQISTRATREEARCLSAQVLRGEKTHTVTQRRRKDGIIIDVEIFGIPLIERGRLQGVYGLYQDLTERFQVQSALRTTSERLQALQVATKSHLPDATQAPPSPSIASLGLTRRELDILKLLASGKTSRSIATCLGISIRTVESHRTNINHKCGFRSVADLVHFAISHDLLARSTTMNH